MKKVLVAYATRTGETQKIAELIAEGVRFSLFQADVTNVNDLKKADLLNQYDALVLGSPTYHGEMIQAMKTFLFLAEQADLAGKVGGAFGAFGWSGEAPERIYQTMKNIFSMEMVKEPLMLKSSSLGGGLQMAQDYGRMIAAKMEEAS